MTCQFRSLVTVFPFVPLLIAAATVISQPVLPTAKEQTIALTTYQLGPEDPNPPFQLVNSNDVYPYTMLDDLTSNKMTVKYKAIVLENEYLRAIVLPELGGRLYSLYDKVAKSEVFYRNESVKFGLIALRGAWISGGIEFNFPNGHTTDTVSPVSSHFQTNADGSVTAIVGDLDQVSEMYWQVSLTLRPHTARLEEHVDLFNPTPVERLYWFWDNAAVPATNDSHFIYPMRQVNPDTPGEYWTFPKWKDVDYSRYKNIHQPTEMFGVNVHRSFFGVYYDNADYGLIHCADYREVTGKKIFTWGTGADGDLWTDLLTDKDGPYNEIQAGRFETQLNRNFMAPNAVHSWTEYWYPVKHLDGAFVEATKQIAINVRFLATTKPKGNIQISISSTETINNATVALSIDGGRTKTFRLSFDPQNARAILIPVDDIATAESSAAVDIVGEAGRTLLHWRASDPIDGNSELAIPANVSPTHDSAAHDRGAEELFLQSALDERQGNRARAQQTLNELLKRDPNNIPVLLKLAIQHDRDGDFRTAEGYIDRAIRLDDSDPVLQYAAGVIYRGAGRMDSAQDAFWASIRLGGPSPQSFLQLGEIALSRRDYEEAERLLRKALLYNPDDALAQCDLAVALRLRGKVSQAGKIAAEAVNMMPLYPVALAERWRIAAVGTPHSTSALTSEHEWGRAVGGRMQNYTEAGSWYWSLHDYISSDFILKTAVQHFAADQISPMIYYYLASNARHEGLQLRATEFSALARKARYDVLFPNRTSDAAVLQEALVANPTDSHAQYFLGTFLFQHGSYDEAAQLWKKAAEADFQYSVLYRDLGLYAWRVKMDYKEASTYFLKAIRLAPLDYHLYVDMDEVDAHEGSTEARETLFANAPSSVVDHDAARIRYCAFLIGAGQAEKALNLLKTHNFKPWEQGQDVHALFVAANILAGRQALAAKRFEDAETDFRYAFEYPRNLGVAKPDKPNDAAARYWLAQAQYEQGDKEAAHREWQRLLDEASGNALSQYYGALALEGLGEAAEAKRQMTVLAEGPARGRTNANDYYVAGLAERQRQREPQAIADFEKALEINPFYWQAENEMKH